jgi:hypothetical protein
MISFKVLLSNIEDDHDPCTGKCKGTTFCVLNTADMDIPNNGGFEY